MSLDGEEEAEARSVGESNLELASDSIDRKTEFAVKGVGTEPSPGTAARPDDTGGPGQRG